ncbi:hypothetical protein BKA66DRAFT_605750 [Pyrenochaeta sp. MPI-SDFR-AT-0127]|nr:hypothetical protein BKA66DRAFT_605750 [Pyrenochaeta sp. MPI-SDFR-AT-0127]
MELEAKPQETATIKHLAIACSQLLRTISDAETDEAKDTDAEDGFWASRQSDVPEICEIFRQLLQSLHTDLTELMLHCAGSPTQVVDAKEGLDAIDTKSDASSLSFESLSSSVGSKSLTELKTSAPERRYELELKRHVGDTINRLEGQARRVERAGAQHRRQRVSIYQEKERTRQVYEGFQQLGIWKANEQFKLASEIFKSRMAESFARRRIRFEYLKEHQQKRAIDMMTVPNNDLEPPRPNTDANVAPVSQTPEEGERHHEPGKHFQQDQQTLFSATVNTQYNLPPEPKKKERVESVKSIVIPHTGFPRPPKIHFGKFQCPYCFLEYRDTEAEMVRWRQHVMQDFEPYFCTYEDCKAPFEVSNSFDGLLEHLQTHLPIRHHVDDPDGEHKELIEAEFEHHMNSHGEVSDDIMAAMKESSRRKGAFLFDSCPFCGGYPDDLEKRFSNRDTLDAQRELRRHIKQHMQEIALFLPPYRSDVVDEDEDVKGSDMTHRKSMNDEIPENGYHIDDICDRIDCDCRSNSEHSNLPPIDDDYTRSEFRALTAQTIDHGWICCICGNNYWGSEKKSCNYCSNRPRCRSCPLYERDKSLIGDWSLLLDSSIYDHSDARDHEHLADHRLHTFILCYAFEWIVDTSGLSLRPLKKDSMSNVRRLIGSLNMGHKEQLPPPLTADGVAVISYLIALNYKFGIQDSRIPSELWEAAQGGHLSLVREITANTIVPSLESETIMTSRSSDTPPKLIGPVNKTPRGNISETELDINDFTPRDSIPVSVQASDRVAAFYKDIPVWIEWVDSEGYPWLPTFGNYSRAKDIILMFGQINKSAHSQAFPVLPYLGTVKNNKGNIGIVFCNPNTVPSGFQPTSLRNILTHDSGDIPSSSTRFRLMGSLYKMIQHLHTSGFLHYTICSDNILLILPSDESYHDFLDPYIIGFNSLYPAIPDDVIEQPVFSPRTTLYRHPLVQQTRKRNSPGRRPIFEKSHDMYSLGIVLLEIAYWKPIEYIMGTEIGRTQLQDEWSMQQQLLGDKSYIVEQIEDSLGDTFKGIIRACIEGETSAWVEKNLPPGDFEAKDSKIEEAQLPPTHDLQLGEKLKLILEPCEPQNSYEDSVIDEVALLLQQFGERAYEAPRTYLILRKINRLDI